MTPEELNEARVNPEFLGFLEEKEAAALESKSISELYEVLDSLLILDLDENRIHTVYGEILKVSFDKIEDRLKDEKKLSLDNDDIYFIRSFYEHAIEKWSCENYDGAKELFFILSQIVEDEKFVDAINIHLLATAQNKDMDSFYEKDVEHQNEVEEEKYGYFILDFKFDVKEYLDTNLDKVQEQYEKLKHLLN
ncbi:MAG: hypothetical protein U9R16_06030 [Campylobacterota bacterium]|nr:hypothetical protein [Campylobacterota bacterium]